MRDWIARLVEGVYWAIGLKQGSVMEGKERLLATRERRKERESGVPNLLEILNLNLPWVPVLIDHSRLLVDGRRAFQNAVPAAQGLSLAVREWRKRLGACSPHS